MCDISINTDIASRDFIDDYKYPEWFNKKKYVFYNKILKRLQRLSYLHTRSSQYYEKMNYLIFGPSITITALSGIASFLSTSQYIDEGTQNGFGIGVGVIASVSSILQALAGACQFSAKTEAHRGVAEQYNNLIISVKFEIEMPNEEDFTDKLEAQILDIQNKCNYFVPQFIVEEFNKKHHKHDKNYKNDKQKHNKSFEKFENNLCEKFENTTPTLNADNINIVIDNYENDTVVPNENEEQVVRTLGLPLETTINNDDNDTNV